MGRNLSAPELPPIGIKPHSPSYSSSPVSRAGKQYGSSLELNIGSDGVVKRTRRSPLSPTSTTSSQEGSSKSLRLSPAGGIGNLKRSRTWTGDLNNSQHGSSKLETLYETPPAASKTPNSALGSYSGLESGLAQLSIIQEGKLETKESKTISTSITAPPPIGSHMTIKSSLTVTHISATQPIHAFAGADQLPVDLNPKTPQLAINKLSQENLKKHRHSSQSSSLSSSAVKANSDTGYDTDDEKDHRISEWLMGVQTSQTEQPPDAGDISTNEKRDTAIHIVYNGDWFDIYVQDDDSKFINELIKLVKQE